MKQPGDSGQVKCLDFRQCAPEGATPELFKTSRTSTSIGGLAVAVPGELKGLEELHKAYGTLPWSRLFKESIELAEGGMEVRGDLYDVSPPTVPWLWLIHVVYHARSQSSWIQ